MIPTLLMAATMLGAESVDAAIKEIDYIIEHIKLIPHEGGVIFTQNGDLFTSGETKVACQIVTTNMYGFVRTQALKRAIDDEEAFTTLMGTYASCTMSFGYIPDFDSFLEKEM